MLEEEGGKKRGGGRRGREKKEESPFCFRTEKGGVLWIFNLKLASFLFSHKRYLSTRFQFFLSI